MSLVHGQQITARQIESFVSQHFGSNEFANLCNSIVWACSGLRCTSLPDFTERSYVQDNGIDGQWEIQNPQDDSPPFILPGWNIYQYKQREIFARNRGTIISNIKTAVRGAIEYTYRKTGRRPHNYVLFTNIHLTNPQKGALEKAILKEYDKPKKVRVSVVGAAELAGFLNNLPYLRSAYFATMKFSSWQSLRSDFDKQKLFAANPLCQHS